MQTIGAYDAKTHLSRLLEEVEAGETITITKHGRAVARLVPAGGTGRRPKEVVAELLEARHDVRLGEVAVRELIDEGRR
jgi:prevent-host-death family protein